jgi:hypothetical protein
MSSIAESQALASVLAQGRGDASFCETLPPIVRTVLTQAARSRARGAITEARFNAQIRRIAQEELEPRGLELQNYEPFEGGAQFLVKVKATGAICGKFEVRY